MENLVFKEIKSFKQFDECSFLEEKIWKLSDRDKLSHLTLKSLAMEYPPMGVMLAAYDKEQIIGFAVYLPTRKPKSVYGHIFGVLPEYRNSNVGFKILLKSRETCLEKGIENIYWTYEPLEGANANLYINKLGVMAIKYELDYYDVQDELNKALPFDRFVTDWRLKSKRVLERLNRKFEKTKLSQALKEYPIATPDYFPDSEAVLVQIPGNLQKMKQGNVEKALEFRMATRKVFSEYMNKRGFAATELFSEVIEGERKNYYLLEKELEENL